MRAPHEHDTLHTQIRQYEQACHSAEESFGDLPTRLNALMKKCEILEEMAFYTLYQTRYGYAHDTEEHMIQLLKQAGYADPLGFLGRFMSEQGLSTDGRDF